MPTLKKPVIHKNMAKVYDDMKEKIIMIRAMFCDELRMMNSFMLIIGRRNERFGVIPFIVQALMNNHKTSNRGGTITVMEQN